MFYLYSFSKLWTFFLLRLKDYDIIEESANDLMHKLNQRNQYATNTQPFAKVK